MAWAYPTPNRTSGFHCLTRAHVAQRIDKLHIQTESRSWGYSRMSMPGGLMAETTSTSEPKSYLGGTWPDSLSYRARR